MNRVAYIQSDGGGTWSAWFREDGPDRRVELLGVDGQGNLFHRRELTAGDWAHWEPEVPLNA